MPKPGSTVGTPDGEGVVLDNNAITEKVRVKISMPDETIEVRSFPLEDVIVQHQKPVKKKESVPDIDKDVESLLE